ncbi:MAG: histidine kinase [Elusimicrobia bacterium RIFOXYA2_FULL_39_19]|nr:MAG: histidine kinase [Elusimicrobia bacterium RIFOXYA2_FULL_39_19]
MKKTRNKTDHNDFINAVSKISKAITSDLYLEDILKLIVTVTAQVMKSEICSIMLFDVKQGALDIKATQSMSEEYIKKGSLKIGEGIAGKVLKENKPIQVLDVLNEPEFKFKDMAKKLGLKSLLCVPLDVKGKPIGALNCYTSFFHKFTDSEIAVLTTVANQAAVVIENANLLVTSNILKEELETRKLVEKAKGIIMKQYGHSEEDAYRLLQKKSMDARKTLRAVAEAVILAKEIEKTEA